MAITEVRTQADIQSLPLRRMEDIAGPVSIRRVSWGAIFAGSAVGIVFELWLAMLGVAIGASTINPMQASAPLAGIGTGSAVWMAISVIISSYIGGWVASRFASIPRRVESALYGVSSWAVSNLATFLFLGSLLGAVVSWRAAAPSAGQTGASAAGMVAGTGWGIVVLMFLGLCAGVGGAIAASPKLNYNVGRKP